MYMIDIAHIFCASTNTILAIYSIQSMLNDMMSKLHEMNQARIHCLQNII